MQGSRQPHSIHMPRNHRSQLSLVFALSATLLAPLAASAAKSVEQPLSKELMNAIQRDLGLNTQQAARYVDLEKRVVTSTSAIEQSLGDAYAGMWIERAADGEHRLVVAVTNRQRPTAMPGLVAQFVTATHSMRALSAAHTRLDQLAHARAIASGIDGWRIDPKLNSVVIGVQPGSAASAVDFVAKSGIDVALARFETSTRRAVSFNTIIAGERYNIPALGPNGWCSIGFPVIASGGTIRGHLSAGHCSQAGLETTGVNGLSQGVVAASFYPGRDYAWIQLTNSAWAIQPWATNYAGGIVQIVGAARAPVGAMVCKSGVRTGYSCGTILAERVTQQRGTDRFVMNLVETNACGGRGDSGGPFFTPGGEAQGITSGGNVAQGSDQNCTLGVQARTAYQPVRSALNGQGVYLFVGSYSGTPPTISSYSCDKTSSIGYRCTVLYASTTPANANFSNALRDDNTTDTTGSSTLFGQCKRGSTFQSPVTVSNAFGSDSRSVSVQC